MDYTKYGKERYNKRNDLYAQVLGEWCRVEDRPNVPKMTTGMAEPYPPVLNMFIKYVVFNPPATVVFWGDGTKTVVKCSKNDIFDPEKGLAMAIAKRVYSRDGVSYQNQIFKKWADVEV